MTEEEWLSDGNALRMLSNLKPDPSDRKLRLFGVAACRRIWHLFDDARSREAVEVSERFADGTATAAELEKTDDAAAEALSDTDGRSSSRAAAASVASLTPQVASTNAAAYASSLGEVEVVHEPEMLWQATVLRDIVGNPCRSVTLNPSWLTGTVTSLAQVVYD
jgi:hypothetical protein